MDGFISFSPLWFLGTFPFNARTRSYKCTQIYFPPLKTLCPLSGQRSTKFREIIAAESAVCWARLCNVIFLRVKTRRVPWPWASPSQRSFLREKLGKSLCSNTGVMGKHLPSSADVVAQFANYLCLGKELQHFHSQVKEIHHPPQCRGDSSWPQTILIHFTPGSQGDFFSSLEEKKWHWRAWFSFTLELLGMENGSGSCVYSLESLEWKWDPSSPANEMPLAYFITDIELAHPFSPNSSAGPKGARWDHYAI